MLNADYKEILQCLAGEKVKFLLVGAYALAVHGYLRATMDMDIWVMPSPENAEAVLRALRRFGAQLRDINAADLQKNDTIFQIGIAPIRIDIITGASGLCFEEAFARSCEALIEGVKIHILSIDDLIRNKKASGWTKDLADIEALETMKKSEQSKSSGIIKPLR